MANKFWSKAQRKWVIKSGRFDNLIYEPNYTFSDRINNLIETGKVKYYPSLKHFKNRAK
mgnify:CR=1 FL=1